MTHQPPPPVKGSQLGVTHELLGDGVECSDSSTAQQVAVVVPGRRCCRQCTIPEHTGTCLAPVTAATDGITQHRIVSSNQLATSTDTQ